MSIEQLAKQAQDTTEDREQLAMILLLLQDAIRRLELLKT